MELTVRQRAIRGFGAEPIVLGPEALNSQTLRELHARIEQSAAVSRVIILSMRGMQPGFDLAEVCAAAERSDLAPAGLFAACVLAICEAKVPVIASVDAKVMGGSVGLIAACDIVIAGSESAFQLPEVIAGMVPALVAPVLARRLTAARAGYLAMSTRAVSAREAHAIGLVDEVADSDVEACVERQVRRIFQSSPLAIAECKMHDRRLAGQSLRQEMEAAIARLAAWLGKPEVRQAVAEFSDGFAPAWSGAAKEQRGSGDD